MIKRIIQIDDDVRIVYQCNSDFKKVEYWVEVLDWEADKWYEIDRDQFLYETTIFDRFMSHIVFKDIEEKVANTKEELNGFEKIIRLLTKHNSYKEKKSE